MSSRNYIVLLIISISAFVNAQSNEGKEFWLGFMHHRDVGNNTKVIIITSKYDTYGQITVPNRGYKLDYTVKANDVTRITMPNYTEVTTSEIIEDVGIRVTSAEPISVYMHQYFGFRSEASLVLPKESIGGDYYVMSYQGVFNSNEEYPSEFMVVATENETTINITPTTPTLNGKAAFETITILLNAGEAYQVQSLSFNQDLTASRVISDKPIALFGGARWTEVPVNCGFRDNLLEQMYSIETWGKQFVGIPAAKLAYSIFRILAAENNTKVDIEYENSTDTYYIGEGEFIEFNANKPFVINANKPILPAQYLIGTNCSGHQYGDPAMLLLNSVEQTRDTVTLYNSGLENIIENYISVILYTRDIEVTTFDGADLSSVATINSIGADDQFSYVTIPVSVGTHTITSLGCGVIASAYGYGDAESYAYSGGASFRPINFNAIPEGGCLNDTILFDSELSPNRFEFYWDLGDGNFSTLSKFEHKYPGLGTYPLSVIIKDMCLDKIDTFYRDIIISLRQAVSVSDDVVICEGESFSIEASDLAGSSYLWIGPDNYVNEEQVALFDDVSPSQSGTYEVIGIISGCATFPEKVEVLINPLPNPNLGRDTFFCRKVGPIDLYPGDYSDYKWSNTSVSDRITVSDADEYRVTVTDINDCVNSDTILIREVCPTEVYIPNVFSPNRDGVNDFFSIEANDVSSIEGFVFDRWGNLIAKFDDIEDQWDGRFNGELCQPGVYVYKVVIEGIDDQGQSTVLNFLGDITLIK